MRRRKKIPDFRNSEPEFLISYLNRHRDWAVIVCLVGGGQEINTGEAGIAEWFGALRDRFSHWRVFLSPRIDESEYGTHQTMHPEHIADERLHLSTSMRSFRTEKVSAFINALLAHDLPASQALSPEVLKRYPISVTRDLATAKRWVRAHSRGTERHGLLASSEAQRLKPHAIDVRVEADPVQWFLNDRNDTRSSYYLEDAATQFQVQGLELDWTCVSWDADLRLHHGDWQFHSFRGDSWTKIHKAHRKRYLLNAYRVLLTRARQGMVIFLPNGDQADPTRLPEFYDETYDYLRALGLAKAED